MAHYMVYWPQDQVEALKKAGDKGPIKVVLGSIHFRMPTIASVKVGGCGVSRYPDEEEAVCHGPAASDSPGMRL